MALSKNVAGPYNLVFSYHKINRILIYSDDSGESSIQLGTYLNRDASKAENAKPEFVMSFPISIPENTNIGDLTIDQIKAYGYESIKEKPDWSEAEDIFEDGQE